MLPATCDGDRERTQKSPLSTTAGRGADRRERGGCTGSARCRGESADSGRHSARTSGRCPCTVHWDAVVTASCEAFCESTYAAYQKLIQSQPQPAVKPSVRTEDFNKLRLLTVTTTASCEAFCEYYEDGNLTLYLSQPQPAVKPSAS